MLQGSCFNLSLPPTLPVEIDLKFYDKILVTFSGGKDSLCCLLWLSDLLGAEAQSKIEIWHHCIDGQGDRFFDWNCTEGYVRAVAEHLKIPLYFSGRVGGFRQEMLRDRSPTAAVWFETPDGKETAGGKSKSLGTRLKFPQLSANLSTRWCSAYLKIMVYESAIRNQKRFEGLRTLTVSGERAQESAARAKYQVFERDRAHANKRHVDRLRPILHWKTEEVWDYIQHHGITPHPAYYLGFGRCSCKSCIFISDEDWATLYAIAPQDVKEVAAYEERFGATIARPKKDGVGLNVVERAKKATPRSAREEWVKQALSDRWYMPIVMRPWVLPEGAFGNLASGSP